MERAKTLLVVRNKEVDLFTRLWCVWELFLAERLGFRKKRATFLVTGSNQGLASEDEVDLANCSTHEPDDCAWILEAINRKQELRNDVVRCSTEVRRMYYR